MDNAYSRAGVDVTAGYEVVERIKGHAARTARVGMMGSLGGFGGCFDLSGFDLAEPVLVSGTDGVGTKLLVAQALERHDTIGIDCVAMCVNDIAAQGAQPLYFLDYIATGRTNPDQLEQVVAGIADGCVEAGAALIGGETAEMPGLYGEDEYDVAGFAVGIAEKSKLITGEQVRAGDLLIGLASSGLHSNGFSLVRQILMDELGSHLPELGEKSVGETILTPTRIYVSALAPLVEQGLVRGAAHITGGGFVENLPRMLPDGLGVTINEGSWPVPPIFAVLEEKGRIEHAEMFEIFNMGLGMVLAIRPDDLDRVQSLLSEPAYVVGEVVDSPQVLIR